MGYDERLIVALDVPDGKSAETLLDRFGEIKPFVKVGMQLFYSAGPEWVRKLKSRGYHIFLDLKLHDIPQTVYHAAQSLARLEVDMMTVHIAGGKDMLRAAVSGIESVQADRVTKIVGITQLTSTDKYVMNEEIGIPGEIGECVKQYARLGQEAGLDGVVCSGWETAELKRHLGHDFLTVTPGIRLAGNSPGDQKRVMTPEQAISNGTDYLVIGRPITQAEEPREMYERISAALAST